ncbi:serine hydroxymethyltransferase cytosolic (glycine hydroxymethyltransferase) [Gracilaria domingensis]|nr:serine hydroxymethyltransferase cytosolic (glycine hydroxymethyltransferase) [Gracilaria domingensis]
MTARRQVKPHDTIVRIQHGGVERKVGGGARVRLHVDAPRRGVQAKALERALLDETLNVIDHLISSIVARAGEALRVLVGEGRAQNLHDGAGREVLAGDELDSLILALLLATKKGVQFGIDLLDGAIALKAGKGIVVVTVYVALRHGDLRMNTLRKTCKTRDGRRRRARRSATGGRGGGGDTNEGRIRQGAAGVSRQRSANKIPVEN